VQTNDPGQAVETIMSTAARLFSGMILRALTAAAGALWRPFVDGTRRHKLNHQINLPTVDGESFPSLHQFGVRVTHLLYHFTNDDSLRHSPLQPLLGRQPVPNTTSPSFGSMLAVCIFPKLSLNGWTTLVEMPEIGKN
jgi:hypothetical protein